MPKAHGFINAAHCQRCAEEAEFASDAGITCRCGHRSYKHRVTSVGYVCDGDKGTCLCTSPPTAGERRDKTIIVVEYTVAGDSRTEVEFLVNCIRDAVARLKEQPRFAVDGVAETISDISFEKQEV